ncbi:GNAT family N-acetyltransferase [Streptomyces avicenniae]|uniref:GNAT family N-acetyltransferase n=1 Tax=Streptomyces avicenniae TaxID=500153 RepID=UPI00069BBFAB|nr:GNAT family protein [Streptomyces avicenniae]
MPEQGARTPGADATALPTDTGLLLRPWAPGDRAAVRDAFAGPLMHRQFGAPLPPDGAVDDAAAAHWLATRAAERAAGLAYSFAVTEGGALVGCAAVGSVNRAHDSGWVSYWTVPAARGRGVAGAALRALSGWCFTGLLLYRLELGHRLDNPASCHVARAAGFTPEGVQRAKLRYGGTRHDVELHARLADD